MPLSVILAIPETMPLSVILAIPETMPLASPQTMRPRAHSASLMKDEYDLIHP